MILKAQNRRFLLLSVPLVLALAGCTEGEENPHTDTVKVSEKRDEEAIKALLRKAQETAKGDDGEAWTRLQYILSDEGSVSKLMHLTDNIGIEGLPLEEGYPDLPLLLKTVAEGNQRRAEETFRLLSEKPLYEYNLYDNRRQRTMILYGAFRHIRKPSGEFIDFLKTKLANKSFDGEPKRKIIEALASYGTPELAVVFKDRVAVLDYLNERALGRYRDRIENARLLVKHYRESKGEYAQRTLSYFLADSIPGAGDRFRESLTLPPIDPQDKAVRAEYVELFEGFLAQPGNRPFTAEEKAKLAALVARLKKSPSQ
jgi:hypothetical protein